MLGRKGAGIRISKLERFLAEKEMELALNRLRGKVAVIGSGPAGLSVAASLAKQNYRVTIFEAQPKAGGVLRYGIVITSYSIHYTKLYDNVSIHARVHGTPPASSRWPGAEAARPDFYIILNIPAFQLASRLI